MAPALSAKQRAQLPASAYAYPKTKRYPIDTPRRARNALSRAAQSKTSGSYATVAKAVRRKYGDRVQTVGPSKGVLSRPGFAKRSRRSGWKTR